MLDPHKNNIVPLPFFKLKCNVFIYHTHTLFFFRSVCVCVLPGRSLALCCHPISDGVPDSYVKVENKNDMLIPQPCPHLSI